MSSAPGAGSAPYFSVIIPTRNRVALLERALGCVAAQTFDDYEVIVVDDGSSDGTPTFLQSLNRPKLRFVRNDPNLGVSGARNRGVALATGRMIVILDDDDETRPDAFAAVHERLAASPELDFLWGGRLIYELDAAGRIIDLREDDWSDLPATVSGTSFLSLVLRIAANSVFVIRRALLQELGGFDEQLRLSEDRDLFITLAQRGCKGAAVARTIIDVKESRGSLSRGNSAHGGAQTDLRVIDKYRDYLSQPENREFLNSYLVAVYSGFLEQGNWLDAMRVLGQLRRRRALRLDLLRQYVRHAPEFRELKALIRYDVIRRLRYLYRNRSSA